MTFPFLLPSGQTFAAVSCLAGTREGHTVLYRHDSYPWNAIGQVTFMWNPHQPIKLQDASEVTNPMQMLNPSEPMVSQNSSEVTNQRQLWIWCHPACWNEVWSELVTCFNLVEKAIGKKQTDCGDKCVNQNKSSMSIEKGSETKVNGTSTDKAGINETKTDEMAVEKNSVAKGIKNQTDKIIRIKTGNSGKLKGKNNERKTETQEKPETHTNPVLAISDNFKTDVVATDRENKVQMKCLSSSVLRFRLTGPESVTVLLETLQKATLTQTDQTTDESNWWTSYYNSEMTVKSMEAQSQFLDKVGECMSPAELPAHCIFATTIRDPRITRPIKRTNVETKETSMNFLYLPLPYNIWVTYCFCFGRLTVSRFQNVVHTADFSMCSQSRFQYVLHEVDFSMSFYKVDFCITPTKQISVCPSQRFQYAIHKT